MPRSNCKVWRTAFVTAGAKFLFFNAADACALQAVEAQLCGLVGELFPKFPYNRFGFQESYNNLSSKSDLSMDLLTSRRL
jgi:hypothetical protein